MARRPSVFVRSLSMDEGRKLQRITRTSKDPVRMRRAIVVMMSGQGQTVRDITSLLQISEDYVRDVIHASTSGGLACWTQNRAGDARKGSVSSSATDLHDHPDRPPRAGRQARAG